MAHRLHLPAGLAGWHLPTHHHGDDAVAVPHEPVTSAFLVAAATWLTAAATTLYLRADGWLPPDLLGGRLTMAVVAAGGAAALSLFAAMLYRFPADIGSRLWSPTLAWAHFAALNAGVIVPLLVIARDPYLDDLVEGRLLAAAVALQATGLVVMIGNMIKSMEGERW